MKTVLTIFFMLLLLQSGAQDKTLSLKECIELALNNNISIKQAAVSKESAGINLQQSKSNLLPDLNGSFGYGYNTGRTVDPLTNGYINQQLASSNVSISSGLILFNGMRLQNLIRMNKTESQLATENWKLARENISLQVILSYLQVLSSDEILNIARAQAEVTARQVDRLSLLVSEGAAAIYQLEELKGQLAGEEISKVNAVNTLQQAKLSLCQQMNIPYNPSLTLQKDSAVLNAEMYKDNPGTIYEQASKQFPASKASMLSIKSAQTNLRIAKAAYFPILSLNANLGSSYSSLAQTLKPTAITETATGNYVELGGAEIPVMARQQQFSSSPTGYGTQLNNNLGKFIGINMQIPLFNRMQTKNSVRLAVTNLKGRQLEMENQQLILKQNIEQAYLDMSGAFQRMELLKGQVKNFEESFRAATIRLESGVLNITEFLISKNNLDRSRINLLQAVYEFQFRTKVLDYYKGTLVP